MPNLGFSATNPCHLYPLAQAVSEIERSITYYSGYPLWRLGRPFPNQVRVHSLRTVVTYGLLRVPARWRPSNRSLFLWQDRNFDQWVGNNLDSHDFVHAVPGQALHTFNSAREKNIRTVLNHATGPSRHWIQVMQQEYQRVGLQLEKETVYGESYLERESREYELADIHCVASSIVEDQLADLGVPREKIWIVPYGADPTIFFPPPKKEFSKFNILFAGQIVLRKGISTLLDALSRADNAHWSVDFYGSVSGEASQDLARYHGKSPLRFHGAVSQQELAEAMRRSSVLVLPSLEEGFGLVVAQALACGAPCIVSDSVGAQDIVRHRETGSVFHTRDASELAEELGYWATQRRLISGDYTWREPARLLFNLSANLMSWKSKTVAEHLPVATDQTMESSMEQARE
jgi:glycosyltransferase involved in cell wall biosynthesis